MATHIQMLRPKTADKSPNQASQAVKVRRKGGRWWQPPREPKPNRRAEERPRTPLGEIRVIIEGCTMADSSKKARKTYLQMMQSIQLTGCSPKLTWIYNPTIRFVKDDARRLHHPHDNALVINFSIADFNTQWTLMDNRSSVDILYYPTF